MSLRVCRFIRGRGLRRLLRLDSMGPRWSSTEVGHDSSAIPKTLGHRTNVMSPKRNVLVRPWLSNACALGVDPPQLTEYPLPMIPYGVIPMRKTLLTALAAWLLVAIMSPHLSRQLLAEGKEPVPAPPKLKVGDMAPDFKLQYFDGTDDKDVTLSQYRGKKNVVLAFYIFAFTGG